MYVTVNTEENVTLGTWHILPEDLVNESIINNYHAYELALHKSNYNVVLFFQGSGGLRQTMYRINMYRVLRKFFHIIVFDHRGNEFH